jgi:hypothetical protein
MIYWPSLDFSATAPSFNSPEFKSYISAIIFNNLYQFVPSIVTQKWGCCQPHF